MNQGKLDVVKQDMARVNTNILGTSELQWTHTHTKKSLSRVRLFATPWIVAHQAPWSMGFSGHEYWSGLPFPSPTMDRNGQI